MNLYAYYIATSRVFASLSLSSRQPPKNKTAPRMPLVVGIRDFPKSLALFLVITHRDCDG
jgi:hypothetical protein